MDPVAYTPIDKATNAEMRYTFGPLYSPNRKDAHGEWVEPDTLHKACIAFMQSRFDAGDNRLNLQHGDKGNHTVGNIVEMAAWPYDHSIVLKQADGREVKQDMPAGTVYAGVIWDRDAWPLVKSGKIGGLSMGGKAVRVKGGDGATMMHMGHKLAKARQSPIFAAWSAAMEPVAEIVLAINARLDVLEKATQHAYVQMPGSDVCDVCGADQEDDVHGPPLDPNAAGFGDTSGDIATARWPWVHSS